MIHLSPWVSSRPVIWFPGGNQPAVGCFHFIKYNVIELLRRRRSVDKSINIGATQERFHQFIYVFAKGVMFGFLPHKNYYIICKEALYLCGVYSSSFSILCSFFVNKAIKKFTLKRWTHVKSIDTLLIRCVSTLIFPAQI